MRSKSIFAFGLVLLSQSAYADKNNSTRHTTPPGLALRPTSPINPGMAYAMRLLKYENDAIELNRRSPFGVPGGLLDFYTDKLESCGTMLMTLREFREQVCASTLSESDVHQLVVKIAELYARVTSISESAQAARTQCETNPFMELSRTGVGQH